VCAPEFTQGTMNFGYYASYLADLFKFVSCYSFLLCYVFLLLQYKYPLSLMDTKSIIFCMHHIIVTSFQLQANTLIKVRSLLCYFVLGSINHDLSTLYSDHGVQ